MSVLQGWRPRDTIGGGGGGLCNLEKKRKRAIEESIQKKATLTGQARGTVQSGIQGSTKGLGSGATAVMRRQQLSNAGLKER